MRTKFLLAASAAVLTAAVAVAAPGGNRFAKLDTDGNGAVTRAEIDAQSAKHFAAIDANKDGFVTKEEMAAKREAMKARWAERQAERGDKADAKDGPREHRGYHASRGGENRGDRFARHDANGDGRVSLAEFQAGGAKRFERLDADKDGSISKDELANAREARRAKRQS